MMKDKRQLVDAIAEGETIWLTIEYADSIGQQTLSQALYERLSAYLAGVDAVWVEGNGNVTIIGDEDIQLTPGGDGCFADFALFIQSTPVAYEWFREPTMQIGFDLGLEEVRIG